MQPSCLGDFGFVYNSETYAVKGELHIKSFFINATKL